MKSIRNAVVASAVLLLLTTHLAAQEASKFGDSEVTSRLAYIQHSLDGGQRAADLWWSGWLIGYSVATAGQLATYSNTRDEKQRQDMRVGSVTTALGVGAQLVFPLEAGWFATRLRAVPGDTPEARRVKLATAESYLRKAAAQENLGRSWKAHAMAAAVNLAAGLTIWLHYDRPARDGLLAFAVGQLISEAQIFSQPMRAVHDLRQYEQRSDFGGVGMAADPRRSWYVSAAPGGFVVGCRF
jgi:hypothetical protein